MVKLNALSVGLTQMSQQMKTATIFVPTVYLKGNARDIMAKAETHNKQDNCFWDADYVPVHPKARRGYCKECPKCSGCAEEMNDE